MRGPPPSEHSERGTGAEWGIGPRERRCKGVRGTKAPGREIVRAVRDHTLCFRCFRAEVNRARARGLTEVTMPLPLQVNLARWVERTRAHDLFLRA